MPKATPLCPVCKRPAAAATRPFCSPRCADVDLGRWFGERYAVPEEDRQEETMPSPLGEG